MKNLIKNIQKVTRNLFGQLYPSTPAFLFVPHKTSSVQAGLQRFSALKNKVGVAILLISLVSFLHSCTTVKEYEKNKLNDAEMALGNRTVEKTELSFQSYREGSSGANAGKVGGGCGCN